MLILVTYDVSTVETAGRRRLRRVAQACEDYGTRVQKSVFECQVGQKEWARLRDRLLSEIKLDEDSLCSRNSVNKDLRLCRLAGPQSPRARARGAD